MSVLDNSNRMNITSTTFTPHSISLLRPEPETPLPRQEEVLEIENDQDLGIKKVSYAASVLLNIDDKARKRLISAIRIHTLIKVGKWIGKRAGSLKDWEKRQTISILDAKIINLKTGREVFHIKVEDVARFPVDQKIRNRLKQLTRDYKKIDLNQISKTCNVDTSRLDRIGEGKILSIDQDLADKFNIAIREKVKELGGVLSGDVFDLKRVFLLAKTEDVSEKPQVPKKGIVVKVKEGQKNKIDGLDSTIKRGLSKIIGVYKFSKICRFKTKTVSLENAVLINEYAKKDIFVFDENCEFSFFPDFEQLSTFTYLLKKFYDKKLKITCDKLRDNESSISSKKADEINSELGAIFDLPSILAQAVESAQNEINKKNSSTSVPKTGQKRLRSDLDETNAALLLNGFSLSAFDEYNRTQDSSEPAHKRQRTEETNFENDSPIPDQEALPQSTITSQQISSSPGRPQQDNIISESELDDWWAQVLASEQLAMEFDEWVTDPEGAMVSENLAMEFDEENILLASPSDNTNRANIVPSNFEVEIAEPLSVGAKVDASFSETDEEQPISSGLVDQTNSANIVPSNFEEEIAEPLPVGEKVDVSLTETDEELPIFSDLANQTNSANITSSTNVPPSTSAQLSMEVDEEETVQEIRKTREISSEDTTAYATSTFVYIGPETRKKLAKAVQKHGQRNFRKWLGAYPVWLRDISKEQSKETEISVWEARIIEQKAKKKIFDFDEENISRFVVNDEIRKQLGLLNGVTEMSFYDICDSLGIPVGQLERLMDGKSSSILKSDAEKFNEYFSKDNAYRKILKGEKLFDPGRILQRALAESIEEKKVKDRYEEFFIKIEDAHRGEFNPLNKSKKQKESIKVALKELRMLFGGNKVYKMFNPLCKKPIKTISIKEALKINQVARKKIFIFNENSVASFPLAASQLDLFKEVIEDNYNESTKECKKLRSIYLRIINDVRKTVRGEKAKEINRLSQIVAGKDIFPLETMIAEAVRNAENEIGESAS